MQNSFFKTSSNAHVCKVQIFRSFVHAHFTFQSGTKSEKVRLPFTRELQWLPQMLKVFFLKIIQLEGLWIKKFHTSDN